MVLCCLGRDLTELWGFIQKAMSVDSRMVRTASVVKDTFDIKHSLQEPAVVLCTL